MLPSLGGPVPPGKLLWDGGLAFPQKTMLEEARKGCNFPGAFAISGILWITFQIPPLPMLCTLPASSRKQKHLLSTGQCDRKQQPWHECQQSQLFTGQDVISLCWFWHVKAFPLVFLNPGSLQNALCVWDWKRCKLIKAGQGSNPSLSSSGDPEAGRGTGRSVVNFLRMKDNGVPWLSLAERVVVETSSLQVLR